MPDICTLPCEALTELMESFPDLAAAAELSDIELTVTYEADGNPPLRINVVFIGGEDED